jgi:hypothetical protein
MEGDFSTLSSVEMGHLLITTPPIENPPPRWLLPEGLDEPAIVVSLDEADRDGERFVGVAGLLISCTIHLSLLLILALIVKSNHRRSQIVMELGTIEVEDETVFLLDFSDVIPPALKYSPDELVAYSTETLEHIAEVGVAPPDLSVRAVSLSADNMSDRESPEEKETNKKKEGVEFFGTHAYGDKFVYVLDVSGSMGAGNGRRMERARVELIRSINDLQPHHSFFVVVYNNHAFNMFDNLGQARLRPATRENKRKAARWISSVKPMGGTMPAGALKIAGDLLPDAVFFLSDGDFIFGTERGVAMDRFMRGFVQARPGILQGHPMGESRFPKSVLDEYAPEIVVHTIAFESEASRKKMELIAESKGGQHRFIQAPDWRDAPRRRAATR